MEPNPLNLNYHTRRTLLKGAAAWTAPLFARQSGSQTALYAYVGCYTTARRHARGDGIHVYRMDRETGTWSPIQTVGNLVNPSFLVLSADRRFLYSVHGDEKYATSFTVDRNTGRLEVLNQAATGGSNGVHQAIDPSGRFLVVANYGTGTVAVLPIEQDGKLRDQVQLVELKGPLGPYRTEQSSSHPHHVVFDPSGKFVLVPDKGLDRIFLFRFDPASGRLSPTAQGSIAARVGSGPRHAAFHPKLPVAWVLNEIGSSIVTCHWDAQQGALQPRQILPTLPSDFTGDSTGAEISTSADGRFVYCSNRGHDSIVVFASDLKTGLLTPVEWVPSRGKTPRFITLDPTQRFFFVTNEQSDNIVSFRMDPSTGRLKPAGQSISNASAVTIAFSGGGR